MADLMGSFDELALLYISVTTLLTTVSILWAVYTVHKHTRLSSIVKFYLFCEHGLMLVFISINFVWGASCIVWSAGYHFPWLNHTVCFMFLSTMHIVYMAQMMLSLNRFFAISFDGVYYAKLLSGKWMSQGISFLVLAFVVNATTTVCGNVVYYDRQIYTFTMRTTGYLGSALVTVIQTVIPVVMWTTALILDVIMLVKLRSQMQYAPRTLKMNTEWRLALQMIVNHVTNILNIIDGFFVMTAGIESPFVSTTIFTASSITWALYTVSKHPRLSTTVKSYFYCEHGLRLSLILMYFSWGTMCILWSADEALPWLGAIIGYLCQSAAIAACMAQLIFSINRFFAISFGGRYYAKLFSGRWWPQVFLFVVVSMGPASVNLVPGNNAYYNKMIYAMLAQDGELSFYYSVIMQAVFPLSVWTITMILDIIMLRKLTIQRKTFAARTTAMKTEWRLAMQMIVNHLSNSMNIVQALILYAFPTDNLFYLFLISTLMTVVLPGLYGLNVVIFLRVPRKSRNQSVIPVSTQGAISKTKLPRST